MSHLLEVDELRTWIAGDGDPVRAVDGVSLTLSPGEALGIVGESGSGKSVLARSIMGLLPRSAVTSGRVLFEGRSVLELDDAGRHHLWGGEVGMVFQDAGRALNPVVRIERQMCEGIQKHLNLSRQAAVERAADALAEVGVPDPKRRLRCYPHELSGGMRQRVMIAMALSCEPKLLIADEPTTALDVTVQRQILDLLNSVRRSHGMSLILISHDLAVVRGRTDRVAVMYAGRVVEMGRTHDVFASPRHQYTAALLGVTPSLDTERTSRLRVIPGSLPDPREPVPGCKFAPRCSIATADCSLPRATQLTSNGDGHAHACLFPVPDPEEGATPWPELARRI